jgi:hypothetical protein
MTLPDYQYDPNFDVNNIPRDSRHNHEYLGPHEGREIALLELGKKGVIITPKSTELYQNLQKYIQSGELVEMDSYNIKTSIFYRPNLEACAKQVHAFQEKIATAPEDRRDIALTVENHRTMGEILGYPKVAIDSFCQEKQKERIQKLRHLNGVVETLEKQVEEKNGFWNKMKRVFK